MVENGYMDHYFPQWLMGNWCDDRNEVWCFDKRSQKVKKKGTSCFARQKDLNKSDLTNLDLEATVFAELDNKHSRYAGPLLLYYVGKKKRVPKDAMRFFIELCLWTAVRNKRLEGWVDAIDFRSSFASDDILQACTDAEITKLVRLQFCKLCHDDVMEKEIKRLTKDFYHFFVVSDNRFITSDLPVQEFGSDVAEAWLDCKPLSDNLCSLIMFPVHPSVMFVATRHKEFAKCHRRFVTDNKLVEANYDAHINSDAEELYFPYPIYDSKNLPVEKMADAIERQKGPQV